MAREIKQSTKQIRLLDYKVHNESFFVSQEEFDDKTSFDDLVDSYFSKSASSAAEGGGGEGKGEEEDRSDDEAEVNPDVYFNKKLKKCSVFTIQLFGIDEEGNSFSLFVRNFRPFFYVKVASHLKLKKHLGEFMMDMEKKSGNKSKLGLLKDLCKIEMKKKLYGFDAGTEHVFYKLVFKNMNGFNFAKNLWYTGEDRVLKEKGFKNTTIYESNIPPLLRFFHINEISPSGWIAFEITNARTYRPPLTTCNHEFHIRCEHIVPLPNCEVRAPYKICSFDIEASSSHGDFPIPVKTYKKLANNVVEILEKMEKDKQKDRFHAEYLQSLVVDAFLQDLGLVDRVFPKKPFHELPPEIVHALTDIWIRSPIPQQGHQSHASKIEAYFESTTTADTMSECCDDDVIPNTSNVCLGLEKEDDEDDDLHVVQYGLDDLDICICESTPGFESGGAAAVEDMSVLDQFVAALRGKTPSWLSPKQQTLEISAQTIHDILVSNTISREDRLSLLNESLMSHFPPLEGDQCTFIGSTFLRYGDSDPYLNHCIVLGDKCGLVPGDNVSIESYSFEKDVLLAWTRLIQREDPDIIIGYNIFGFDYQFLFHRSNETKCSRDFFLLSRNRNESSLKYNYKTKEVGLEETTIMIASGQHDLKYPKMTGRVQIDLYNYFRREENLSSYKLDYVSGYFIGDKIIHVVYSNETNSTTLFSKNLTGIVIGTFVHLEEIGHSVEYYADGAKFEIVDLNKEAGWFVVAGFIFPDMLNKRVRWCLAKDDVSPQDIFTLTRSGSPDDLAVIAKYCIQDCNLVHQLMNKVDILTGFIEMATICSVPIDMLVFRGQGIKLLSYIAKKCREKNTLLPVLPKAVGNEGYEGAYVFKPKEGFYNKPVACVDYASLYPSSMISENLSHDSKVWTKEYNLKGELIREAGDHAFDHLPGYEYVDITYDTYCYERKSAKSAAIKIKTGFKTCRFAQFPNNNKAIMPSILEELLQARKRTRKLIPQQTDDFMKNVLDKRQLGYKVTANSLYGQCGARTSAFYEKDIAASTTATGRLLLTYARRIIEEVYGDLEVETANHGVVHTHAEYIYGDTDSVFFTFNLMRRDSGKDGGNEVFTPISGKEALEITIELAQQAGHLASMFLKAPHDLEYEKTFLPFCLLSKKRYVGMLYETDPNYGKRKEMGIVLKRRDNAPIVKDIYGGLIDILMKKQNVEEAIAFLRCMLQQLVDKQCPIEKLIITKSLRSGYKNPMQIAHKVLADRMTARDPGNKPAPGDRIPFVYIATPATKKALLQGDKIETPAFVREAKLKIDYSFYITNQIMKPVQQLMALMLEQIWGNQNNHKKLKHYKAEEDKLRLNYSAEKYEDKRDVLRNKEVKELIFDPYLRISSSHKESTQLISNFFK